MMRRQAAIWLLALLPFVGEPVLAQEHLELLPPSSTTDMPLPPARDHRALTVTKAKASFKPGAKRKALAKKTNVKGKAFKKVAHKVKGKKKANKTTKTKR